MTFVKRTLKQATLLFILLLIGATNFVSAKDQSNNHHLDSEQERWTQWKNKYSEGRQSADGWLSLVGLYWLTEGKNTVGTARSNQHILPKGMPRYFAEIIVDGDNLVFNGSSKDIEINQKTTHTSQLIPNETVVSYQSFSFYIIKREKGYAIRLKDEKSPYLINAKPTEFFPYNKNWLVKAKLVRPQTPRKLKIATVYGTIRDEDSAGVLEFQFNGKNYQLEAVSYGEEESMSLMFADETGQETTYGAGRYLNVDWPKDGDITTINFNFSYNPPCAITSFATCPLPPRQNRLGVEVTAGEMFKGH